MADLDTGNTDKTPESGGIKPVDDPQATPPTGTPATDPVQGADTAVITFSAAQQAHIDRVVEERLSRQKAQFKKTEEDAKKVADQKRLVEQGEFKALADQRQERIVELEAELVTIGRSRMRATAAAKHKLPEELISRIIGDTEDEIDADAARLVKLIAPPKAPNAEGGERSTQTRAQSLERAKQEALASGRYTG